MSRLIIYFDERYISNNSDNNNQEVLFNSSFQKKKNKDIKDINFFIDQNSTEIRNIVWD
jgi:hypothetical protein